MSGKGKHAQASAEAASSTLDPVVGLGKFAILLSVLWTAYTIRLHAVNVYGRVIHEFDPWFNFRATQYLVDNGAHAFWNWYDLESWYPLGRPVGTTIYAGLQFTSAYIYYALQALGTPMSLNDVCVFVPAWFGPVSTLFVAGMAYEASFSTTSALAAAFFMSISPAPPPMLIAVRLSLVLSAPASSTASHCCVEVHSRAAVSGSSAKASHWR